MLSLTQTWNFQVSGFISIYLWNSTNATHGYKFSNWAQMSRWTGSEASAHRKATKRIFQAAEWSLGGKNVHLVPPEWGEKVKIKHLLSILETFNCCLADYWKIGISLNRYLKYYC